MKKLFFTLCALCLCGTMWGVTSDSRYYYDTNRPTDPSAIYVDATTQLYFFVNTSGGATLTYINEADDDDNAYKNSAWVSGYTFNEALTIPETVQAESGEEYNVTAIGWYAFYKAGITGPLTIPEYITELGYSAFEGNTEITEVTLEYNSTALNEANNQAYGNSFYGCSGIKTVNLNREVNPARGYGNSSNWGYLISPFSYLTSIETIYVGAEVKEIMYNMFNCNGTSSCSLKDVYCYATDHIPTLEYQAFGLHNDLTLHVYDELVDNFQNDSQTYSWSSFFSTIEGMGSVPLDEGTYKDEATGLFFELDEEGNASIYRDEAGIYTDENLVPHSTITDAYTIPEKVSADSETYYDVTRIEANAFEGSSISGHLVIPAHIVNMGESAFYNCTGIEEVTYEYSETPLKEENDGINGVNQTGGSFQGCTSVTTVNLYRDIEYLSSLQQPGAFVNVSSITTLNIGPRVEKIPNYMFRCGSSANGLTAINCYSVNPPTLGSNALGVLSSNCVVNVPQGSLSDYEEKWTEYNSTSTSLNSMAELTNAFAITTHDNNEGTAYATFYNGAANVELFDGELTAYYAYALDDEGDAGLYIEIAEIGNYVPAATGVIVETEEEGTYLAIATGENNKYSGNNDLYGYDEATPIDTPSVNDYYFYLLSSSGGNVGFYWGAQNGAAFTCQAHRAYLALLKDDVDKNPNQISIRKGNGGEDTTGISSVESTVEGASVKGIYTIQGVRVSNMNQPGLYIVDGKKVLKR